MIQRRALGRRRSTRAGKPARVTAQLAATLLAAGSFVFAAPATAQPINSRSVSVSVVDLTPTSPPSSTAPTPVAITLDLTNNTDQMLTNVRVDGARADPLSTRSVLSAAILRPQPPDPQQLAPITQKKPVTVTLGPRATVRVAFTTTTATDNSIAPGVCICQNRIYPLFFSVHARETSGADVVVGTTRTFVPSFNAPPTAPTRVSWVWPIIDRPHRVVGDTTFTDDDLAYLVSGGRLDRVLIVAERVATFSTAMTLVIDPELIDELAVMAGGSYLVRSGSKTIPGTGTEAAGKWLARLRTVLAADPKLELEFTPLADPDIESLSRNGLEWTTGLPPAMQARVTAALGGRAPAKTVGWPVDGALSSSTLDALVRAGASEVIVADATLPSTEKPDAAANQLGTLQTPAGQITAIVTQRDIQREVEPTISLGGPGAARLPELVSEVAVAALSATQPGPYVAITAPREVNPNPDVAARAILETADTFWSTSLTLSAAAHAVQPSDHGQLVQPRDDQGQLSDLTLGAARTVSRIVPALATMLSTADASRLLGSLPTAVQRAESAAWRIDSTAGDAFAADLRSHIEDIESGVRIVRPSAGTYTLTSTNSPLPVTVENNLGVTVRVRVELSSANDLPGFTAKRLGLQTIAANTKVTLHIPTHVERAGRFRVQAVLVTPSGVPIGNPVLVSVHSTALGVIGVVITVVAAVVLAFALLVRFIRRLRSRRSSSRPAELT